jgi:hypothetical protein
MVPRRGVAFRTLTLWPRALSRKGVRGELGNAWLPAAPGLS